jgi:hypothetical protein
MDGRSMLRFSRRVTFALAALAIAIPAIAGRADADIYWSTNNAPGQATVSKADVTSTANPIPVTPLFGGLVGASAMAVDATYVYWASPNAIWRAPLTGGSVPQEPFITGVFNANALAVDRVNQYVYWADTNSGYIGRAALVQNAVAQPRYFSTLGVASGLAIDYAHGYLYWTQPSNRLIGRIPLAGGTPNLTYLTGLLGAQGITVDSTYLYWANGPLTIGRAPLDGSSAPDPDFVSGAQVAHRSSAPTYAPTGLAVDNSYIYWANHMAFTIGRAPITGGSANINNKFIYTLVDPTAIALDVPKLTSPGPLPPAPPVQIAPLELGVQSLALPHGLERALLAKLDAGQEALDAGDLDGACARLQAYINQVDAQSGKKIYSASADGLIAHATAVANSLRCDLE